MTAASRFFRSFRARPVHATLGILTEYAGFVAACVFVLVLLLLRWPLGMLDTAAKTSIRRRLIDAVAVLSPG